MSEISQKLQDRMAALVRDLLDWDDNVSHKLLSPVIANARAIAALLPAPIDPDLIEARRLAEPWLIYDNPGSGDNDDSPTVQALLAAIKRGRELAQAGK